MAANNVDYGYLFDMAKHAAAVAVAAMPVKPMVVRDGEQTWTIPDGLCGFAWVKFMGRHPLINYLKKRGLIRKSYPTGYDYWISDYRQSHARKARFAEVLAEQLRSAFPDLKCWDDSRLD